jgi:hypothetical protein
MARRLRLNSIAAQRDQRNQLIAPSQTLAGPWPTSGNLTRGKRTINALTRSGRVKKNPLRERNVTAREVQAALAREPSDPKRKMRIFILGVHQSDPSHVDYKATASRRRQFESNINGIVAERDRLENQLVNDEMARLSAYRGRALTGKETNLIHRRASVAADDWEQGALIAEAERLSGFSYRRVIGFTVARGAGRK